MNMYTINKKGTIRDKGLKYITKSTDIVDKYYIINQNIIKI